MNFMLKVELAGKEEQEGGESREKFVELLEILVLREIDSASGEDKGKKMMTRVRKQVEEVNISDEGQENCKKRDFRLDD